MGSPIGTPEVPPRPDVAAGSSNRRRVVLALLGLAVVAVIAIVLLSAVGPCSEEDLQLAQRSPYGGAQLEYVDDPEGPSCVAVLEVEASGTEVLDHYEAVLEDDGWDVTIEDVPVESPEEGVTVTDLVAIRDESDVTIALESFDGHVSGAIRVDA